VQRLLAGGQSGADAINRDVEGAEEWNVGQEASAEKAAAGARKRHTIAVEIRNAEADEFFT